MEGIDFGAVEGGLTGALVVITTIAKWVQAKMAEQIEDLKEQLIKQNEEQDDHLDEYKLKVDKKFRKLKKRRRKQARRELELKVDKLLTLVEEK
jgi:hypothetical protein